MQWTILMNTSDLDIDYKIDTGAQANIIPLSLYKTKISQDRRKVGSEIPVVGKCIVRLKPEGKKDFQFKSLLSQSNRYPS